MNTFTDSNEFYEPYVNNTHGYWEIRLLRDRKEQRLQKLLLL